MPIMHRHRFDILLGSLILVLLSGPIAQLVGLGGRPLLAQWTINGLFIAMLLSALYAVSRERRTVWIAMSLVVPTVLLKILNMIVDATALVVVEHLLEIAFLGFTAAVLLRYLFRCSRVTTNVIFASLCVYLLLGVLWAFIYSLIVVVEPGAFALQVDVDEHGPVMRLSGKTTEYPLYYSFVTLTTLGYGDVVPIAPGARMFAVVEALVGQMYLTVLVARLVGLHIAQASRSSK